MHIKKCLFPISLLILISLSCFATIISAALTPQNTVFLFDVDDVLIKKNMGPTVYAWAIISHPFWRIRWGKIKEIIAATKQKDTPIDKAVLIIKNQFDDPVFADVIKYIGTYRTVVPGMPEIIKNLHEQGFKLFVATNKGTEEFIHDISNPNQQPTLWGNIFKYFDLTHPQTVTYSWNTDTKTIENTAKKPELAYFKEALSKNNINTDDPSTRKNVIFIDDDLSNIHGAQEAGINHAILFTDSQKLRSDLTSLGIPLP